MYDKNKYWTPLKKFSGEQFFLNIEESLLFINIDDPFGAVSKRLVAVSQVMGSTPTWCKKFYELQIIARPDK